MVLDRFMKDEGGHVPYRHLVAEMGMAAGAVMVGVGMASSLSPCSYSEAIRAISEGDIGKAGIILKKAAQAGCEGAGRYAETASVICAESKRIATQNVTAGLDQFGPALNACENYFGALAKGVYGNVTGLRDVLDAGMRTGCNSAAQQLESNLTSVYAEAVRASNAEAALQREIAGLARDLAADIPFQKQGLIAAGSFLGGVLVLLASFTSVFVGERGSNERATKDQEGNPQNSGSRYRLDSG